MGTIDLVRIMDIIWKPIKLKTKLNDSMKVEMQHTTTRKERKKATGQES